MKDIDDFIASINQRAAGIIDYLSDASDASRTSSCTSMTSVAAKKEEKVDDVNKRLGKVEKELGRLDSIEKQLGNVIKIMQKKGPVSNSPQPVGELYGVQEVANKFNTAARDLNEALVALEGLRKLTHVNPKSKNDIETVIAAMSSFNAKLKVTASDYSAVNHEKGERHPSCFLNGIDEVSQVSSWSTIPTYSGVSTTSEYTI